METSSLKVDSSSLFKIFYKLRDAAIAIILVAIGDKYIILEAR